MCVAITFIVFLLGSLYMGFDNLLKLKPKICRNKNTNHCSSFLVIEFEIANIFGTEMECVRMKYFEEVSLSWKHNT